MPWQPMEMAPKDGTVFEAISLDWGTGPGQTIYRVRSSKYGEHWFNWDNKGEVLDYLQGWRPLPPDYPQPKTHAEEEEEYWATQSD